MARFQSIGAQFLDGAGQPLVSGKLTFFESGTTTLKDTFADVNLTIANTNPVIFSGSGRLPNVFFAGVAKAILTDSDDVQIEVRDFLEGISSTTTFQKWSVDVVYNADDIVQGSDGKLYISNINGNIGNDPTTTSGFWGAFGSLDWVASVTYGFGSNVIGSDGVLYASDIAGNLGNDPTTTTGFWTSAAGVSLALVQASVLSFQ